MGAIVKHITEISGKAVEQLIVFEGLKLKPYLCEAGVATVGIGTTRYPNGVRVTMKDAPITERFARVCMLHDLAVFEKGVDALTVDSISQCQFDALVLFAYNVGLGALKGSTLLKKVNRNPDDITIADEFTKWIYADGKRVKGLLIRRNIEAKMYRNEI
jgi:lysozyme